MKFKSHTKELKYIINFILLGGLISFLGYRFRIPEFNFLSEGLIIGGTLGLVILVYSFYGMTNYDFTLTDKEIIIENTFSFFKKKYSIRLDNIRKIHFRDDSIINMFSEYKYVIIHHIDKEGTQRRLKLYCNGLEFDCNGDNANLPTYDDFFQTLQARKIIVEWIKK